VRHSDEEDRLLHRDALRCKWLSPGLSHDTGEMRRRGFGADLPVCRSSDKAEVTAPPVPGGC
jgi:hypothetical protein